MYDNTFDCDIQPLTKKQPTVIKTISQLNIIFNIIYLQRLPTVALLYFQAMFCNVLHDIDNLLVLSCVIRWILSKRRFNPSVIER